jgi:hypothetical protein
MEHQPFVYGLYDPAEAGHIRYVGMAPSRASRPYDHARRARNKPDSSHLLNWIRKIQSAGREPSVMIFEQLPNCSGRMFLGFIESCYIKSLRQIGHQLTNDNDGGWGGSNGQHSEEARARMRAGWTAEVRARVGAASKERETGKKHPYTPRTKGRKFSEQHREGIGKARKDAWDNATPEERAVHAAEVSKARKGKGLGNKNASVSWSDERRAHHGESQKGNQNALGFKQSEETKAKRSASLKAAWARRKKENNDA